MTRHLLVGIDAREDRRAARRPRAEAPGRPARDLVAGQDAVDGEPDLRRRRARATSSLSPVTILTATPSRASAAIARRVGLGRVDEGERSRRTPGRARRAASSRSPAGVGASSATASTREPPRRRSSSAAPRDAARAPCVVERTSRAVVASTLVAAASTASGAPLVIRSGAAVALDQDTTGSGARSRRAARRAWRRRPRSGGPAAAGQDRRVERVAEAGLEVAVELGQLERLGASAPSARPRRSTASGGPRSGCPVLSVHRTVMLPEVLDRRQALDEHPRRGQRRAPRGSG